MQAASKKANSASAMKNPFLLVILVALDSRMAGKAGIHFAVALFVEEQQQKQNGFRLALE
ncbi:hypothetical protein J5837_11715 [Pseudoxanthomonas helianthi]|uniref:Uncharacterized protein n=1 Tax=Pseudoxanthomonas helianthi TaxID=1453541 RepID=A0A940X372_9GAMM|nr:hypothetical protein [Pseudoxanthomonas helianthi]MBP3985073.1 hypothetical protein [Pseudoxanthomonas helianthi]